MTTPRRLKRPPQRDSKPPAVLRTSYHITADQAAQIKRTWRQAQREGVVVLGPDVEYVPPVKPLEPPATVVSGPYWPDAAVAIAAVLAIVALAVLLGSVIV